MVWEPKSIFLEQGWHSFHNYEGTLPTVTWNKSEVPALSLDTFFISSSFIIFRDGQTELLTAQILLV